MDTPSNPLIKQLEAIGMATYYEQHSKILNEMKPNGDFTSQEWNEASVEAIIKAVAVMIESSGSAPQTASGCSKNEP